jgi:hypothetical protein
MFFHHTSIIYNTNPIFFCFPFCLLIVYSKLHPKDFDSIFFLITSSKTAGTSSDLLNTSTISIFSGTCVIHGYDFLPITSVNVGFTGITLTFLLLQYFSIDRIPLFQNLNMNLRSSY